MDPENPLQGSCTCGRIQYLIFTPSPVHENVYIQSESEWTHGLGLSLRIPLVHLRTTTHAFHPDESHHSIRRVFSPSHAPYTKRHFCGFCGTPLTLWNESSHEESNWICVNVRSLRNESVSRLKQSLEDESQEQGIESVQSPVGSKDVISQREFTGNPWFEEIIEGSELGRIKRKRGGHTSADGKSKFEWEVVEMNDDDQVGLASASKRKLDASTNDDGSDVKMRAVS